MLSPLNALKIFRDELVMDRRRFIDQKEKIDDLQSEIESIDRAMADEKDIESDIDKNAMALTSMPGSIKTI